MTDQLLAEHQRALKGLKTPQSWREALIGWGILLGSPIAPAAFLAFFGLRLPIMVGLGFYLVILGSMMLRNAFLPSRDLRAYRGCHRVRVNAEYLELEWRYARAVLFPAGLKEVRVLDGWVFIFWRQEMGYSAVPSSAFLSTSQQGEFVSLIERLVSSSQTPGDSVRSRIEPDGPTLAKVEWSVANLTKASSPGVYEWFTTLAGWGFAISLLGLAILPNEALQLLAGSVGLVILSFWIMSSLVWASNKLEPEQTSIDTICVTLREDGVVFRTSGIRETCRYWHTWQRVIESENAVTFQCAIGLGDVSIPIDAFASRYDKHGFVTIANQRIDAAHASLPDGTEYAHA